TAIGSILAVTFGGGRSLSLLRQAPSARGATRALPTFALDDAIARLVASPARIMALVVQKYGGTSVCSIERMKHVAERVIAKKREGHDVVVVVSAMSGETDRLVSLAKQISEKPEGREYDVLLATGEQASVALVSMWLESLGQPATSFLGHQM